MARESKIRRDSIDFRDRIYQAALIKLPPKKLPNEASITVLDQGTEGACTGFALAGMINYLNRERGVKDDVSPRMLYEMAKRHDHWPGDDYAGSSIRGAMKGWSKNGVCAEEYWPYESNKPGYLTAEAQLAALKYPLGAYYRVQKRRPDFHAALNEAGAILVSAAVHQGWDNPDAIIQYTPGAKSTGGHAFVIVGYTEDGFLIQNSWGEDWGGIYFDSHSYSGTALWHYEDFEDNLWDAWVARMALPVASLDSLQGSRYSDQQGASVIIEKAPPRHVIRNHYIHIDDGHFDPHGDFPSYKDEVDEILDIAINGHNGSDRPKHLVFYAHGGLNTLKATANRVNKWRDVFARNNIHEIHFMWETGFVAELRDILFGKQKFAEQRVGGFGDWWDKFIERKTQLLGHALWKEMQTDAEVAFQGDKAGTTVLEMTIKKLSSLAADARPTLHFVGHSAGSIWFSWLLNRWRALDGPEVNNLVLFAPACTHDLYQSHVLPALQSGVVKKLRHFLLSKQVELDDNVATLYRKSLLYLVSRSYQNRTSAQASGRKDHYAIVPIMGLEECLSELPTAAGAQIEHYTTTGTERMTASSSHGGFDNDLLTMNNMLCTILDLPLGSPLATGFTVNDIKGY